jgi:SAM-dependent methyltransferase
MKKLISKIDRLFFRGFFRQKYLLINANKNMGFLGGRFNYGFVVQYKKYDDSFINNLCDTYGSDKGEVSSNSNPYVWSSHNYADFYNLIFGLRRNDVRSVVECGLGTNNPNIASSMGVNGKPGASLRVWRDYFPNANVIGCDIDGDILFNENRIKTFQCDQTSSNSIHNFLCDAELVDDSVDIIIDDGLHKFFAGKCFFENMISYLRADGIYIIEDINQTDVIKYKEYFSELDETYEARFVYLKSPQLNFGGDNNLICVTKKSN